MPRSPAHSEDALITAAMRLFWMRGYGACSMDEIVTTTGVSRYGIYESVGGKRDLFLRGFAAYARDIVAPAAALLEERGADVEAIAAYFEMQIALAERAGLPGPGCFVANAMTETAPHDREVRLKVEAHNARLKAGFRNALKGSSPRLRPAHADALAEFLVTTAQGLWSMSRIVDSGAPLRAHVTTLMTLLKARIGQ
jgi:TetR/AcrR family transcriptional regulator, transcriptional repressor for nem operon